MARVGFNTRNPDLKKFKKEAAELLKKIRAIHLIQHADKFKDFWLLYQKAYSAKVGNGFQRPSIDFKNEAKAREKAGFRLAQIKFQKSAALGQGAIIDQDNYIVEHWKTVSRSARRKKTTVEKGQEIDVVEEKKFGISRKKIVEISFASDITKKVVERVTNAENFKQEFLEDYLKQVESQFILHNNDSGEKEKKGVGNKARGLESSGIGGGGESQKKPKFNFQHLSISNNFRQYFHNTAEQLKTQILTADATQLNTINKKLDTIAKLIDTTRKLDMQPIFLLNTMAEGGFNTQKELNGAVVNDKAMIDNGQIKLEEEAKEKPVNSDDLKEDLEKIGKALLEKQIDELIPINFSENKSTIREAEYLSPKAAEEEEE